MPAMTVGAVQTTKNVLREDLRAIDDARREVKGEVRLAGQAVDDKAHAALRRADDTFFHPVAKGMSDAAKALVTFPLKMAVQIKEAGNRYARQVEVEKAAGTYVAPPSGEIGY